MHQGANLMRWYEDAVLSQGEDHIALVVALV